MVAGRSQLLAGFFSRPHRTLFSNYSWYGSWRTFNLIFADPPYELAELPTLPDLIFEQQMLSEGGLFVLEHGKKNDFSTHPHFVEQRIYGSVHFSFFQ